MGVKRRTERRVEAVKHVVRSARAMESKGTRESVGER